MEDGSVSLSEGVHGFLGPSVVIVGEHDSFGHAGCSTGVDKSTAVSGLYFLGSSLDDSIVDSGSLCNKFLVGDDSSFVLRRLILIISIDNDEFDDSFIEEL